MTTQSPTSELLRGLLTGETRKKVTLEWLISGLGRRSFGLVLFLLGVIGLLPGVSLLVALLLAVLAVQMMRGRARPIFPRRLASLEVQISSLSATLDRVVPVLAFLEQFVHPRWPTPFETTKRVVGGVILLTGGLFLPPVPLTNLPPAFVVMLISIAYLEEDGVLLSIGLGCALLLLAGALVALWEIANSAGIFGGPS
jgi:hypothetical protein